MNVPALIDYGRKRWSLYDGSIVVPLLTAVDLKRIVCTACKIRIPPKHEALIPIKTPCGAGFDAGIMEALPQTSKRGLSVASILVSCSTSPSMCRVMNPTSRSITWTAGQAFAYLTPFEVNAVDGKLVDMTECINENRTSHAQTESTTPNGGKCRVEGRTLHEQSATCPTIVNTRLNYTTLGLK